MDDTFILNLSAVSASATAWVHLTATVLRPDIVVEEVALYRGDGTRTNDTIHGVAGDIMDLRVRVSNHGPTYSISFNLTIFNNGTPVQDRRISGLASGESIWSSFQIIADMGHLNITARADHTNDIPEMNEDNNNLTKGFMIKSTLPVGNYIISGEVRNSIGEGVEQAHVTFEWSGNHSEVVTDGKGSFSLTLNASEYADTMILFLNATDGNNLTSARILLFSEDGGNHLILTLNQYIVEINGPDMISTIHTGGITNITIEVRNLGNINANFTLLPMWVPDDWIVEFQNLQEGKLYAGIDERVQVDVSIHASDNPEYSRGYQRYYLTLIVSAEINPDVNDTCTHRIEVIPHRSIVVSVIGENISEAEPREERAFDLMARNMGNINDSFIPELLGDPLEDFQFNISYAMLGISDSARFSIRLTMPHLPAGEYVDLVVGGIDEYTENVQLRIRALDHYAIACTYPGELAGKPGERITIPLTVTNTGNLQENITITPYSSMAELDTSSGYLLLEMEESALYTIDIILPADALSGAIISFTVNLTTGRGFWQNITVNITVKEMCGISLTLVNTTIIPGTDFTIYHYLVTAENTGNGLNTYSFQGGGSHPDLLALPNPLTLHPRETRNITVQTMVPMNFTGVVDDYLMAMDGDVQSAELNLRIHAYTPHLIPQIDACQIGEAYIYVMSIANNGTRFERLTPIIGLPEQHWEGSVKTGFLELMPGEMDRIEIRIRTPELREYWGGELSVTLKSGSEKSNRVILNKPPMAILDAVQPGQITFEDTLTFTGSRSYWNIEEFSWDFGDGATASGSTVSHIFRKAGEYIIKLTVRDENNFTASRSLEISVVNQPPVPFIQTSPLNGTIQAGKPIILDGSHSLDRDGQIVHYRWECEGKPDRDWPVIEEIFQGMGDYRVTLHVTDNSGGYSNISRIIHVVEPTYETQNGADDDIGERTTVDPRSYIPAVGALIVILAGIVAIMRKRSFQNHINKKIAQIREEEGQQPTENIVAPRDRKEDGNSSDR